MKNIFLAFFVFVGFVPFVSPAWGVVTLSDVQERVLSKRDTAWGDDRRSGDIIEDRTEETESGTEDVQSRIQELSDERDQRIEEDERMSEEAYETKKEVVQNVGR